MEKNASKWKVLIVDDEPFIHDSLKINLRSISHAERGVALFHAYSATEAKEFLTKEKDIAVIILDVMMESDDAGLNFVKYIREELKNEEIRIILHTGQPGIAPKKEVSEKYVIDGYLDKNLMDIDDCYVSVRLALKSYDQLTSLKKNSQRDDVSLLGRIADTYAYILTETEDAKDYEVVVEHLNTILHLSQEILASYALEDLKRGVETGTTKTERLTQQDYSTLVDVHSIKMIFANTPLEEYPKEREVLFQTIQRAAQKFSALSILSETAKEKLEEVLELSAS